MAKYVYPAVFEKEDHGYSIYFPDLPGCYSQGDTLEDGIEMATDALSLWMYRVEEDGETIPPAKQLSDIKCVRESFATYIVADTDEYQRKFNSKAVKKTLTIPGWLNYEAEKKGVNFSKTLQEALEKKVSRA